MFRTIIAIEKYIFQKEAFLLPPFEKCVLPLSKSNKGGNKLIHPIESFRPTDGWWRREETGEYLPVISKDEPNLVGYLKHSGIITDSKVSIGACI